MRGRSCRTRAASDVHGPPNRARQTLGIAQVSRSAPDRDPGDLGCPRRGRNPAMPGGFRLRRRKQAAGAFVGAPSNNRKPFANCQCIRHAASLPSRPRARIAPPADVGSAILRRIVHWWRRFRRPARHSDHTTRRPRSDIRVAHSPPKAAVRRTWQRSPVSIRVHHSIRANPPPARGES